MKITTLLFIFVLSIFNANAQLSSNKLTTNNSLTKVIISSDDAHVTSTEKEDISSNANTLSENKNICQAEKSKTAYYEALIRQNNFNINDENSEKIHDLVLKNTEDIISNPKSRISYVK